MSKIKITKNTPLKEIKDISKECKKCGKCCMMGSGFLADEDLPRIAKYLGISEEELIRTCLTKKKLFNTERYKPNIISDSKGKTAVHEGYGRCIFYDENRGCIIHEVKPLECRISSCKEYGPEIIEWFNLNFFVNPNDPKSIREWALKLKGSDTIEGGSLNELVKDKEWLRKVLNMEIL